MDSKQKLAAALEEAGAPRTMIEEARSGRYSDYDSESATPCTDLVRDAKRFGLRDIERRAKKGEFDATQEESDAWARRMAGDPEVGPILRKLGLGARQ